MSELSAMEDELSDIDQHLSNLSDPFVPASLSEEETAAVMSELVDVRSGLRLREEGVREASGRLRQWREEVEGLSLWMKEVETFLTAEEAALGDMETLEAQLKESNALQERGPRSDKTENFAEYFSNSKFYIFKWFRL